MKCKTCGTELPEDAVYCTHCGINQETGQRADGDAPDSSVYPMLAEANLFRMRGNWEAAEQKCVEVLRMYPNNATAHSLLGDIYANQGRWEEAVQWYQLATDLDPSNQADRAKLEQARQRLLSAPPAQRASALSTSGGAGRHSFLLGPRAQFAIIVVLTCVVALLYLGTRPKQEDRLLRPESRAGAALPQTWQFSPPAPPIGNATPPSPTGELGQSSGRPAAPGPWTAERAPASANVPGNAPAGNASAPAPVATETAPVPPAADLTEAEARALARLRSSLPMASAVGAGYVTGLVWDPIGSRAMVTVVFSRPLTPEQLREEALRTAYRMGQALSRIDIRNFQVIVKAVLQTGRGPEIALAAEAVQAQPNAWALDAERERPESLLPAFSRLWWHPRLR